MVKKAKQPARLAQRRAQIISLSKINTMMPMQQRLFTLPSIQVLSIYVLVYIVHYPGF